MDKLSSSSNWVEFVLYNIEWSRYLPSLVKHVLIEHLLSVEVVDDVAISVNQVASLVRLLPILISEVAAALFLFSYNNVPFIIPIESTNNVTLIEASGANGRWTFEDVFADFLSCSSTLELGISILLVEFLVREGSRGFCGRMVLNNVLGKS
jgi:hypothetical protein